MSNTTQAIVYFLPCERIAVTGRVAAIATHARRNIIENTQFSVGEVVKFSWRTMKEHLPFFIILLVVTLLINVTAVLPIIVADEYEAHLWVRIATTLLHLLILSTINLGLIRIALSFVDEKKPSICQLFTILPRFGSYFIASIFYVIIVLVGLLPAIIAGCAWVLHYSYLIAVPLLIVPGCVWGLRYSLYPYFIVDKQVGPIEALTMSSEATMGAKWDLCAYAIVSGIIYLLGITCLFVGLFIAIPVIMVGHALIYRRLER